MESNVNFMEEIELLSRNDRHAIFRGDVLCHRDKKKNMSAKTSIPSPEYWAYPLRLTSILSLDS